MRAAWLIAAAAAGAGACSVEQKQPFADAGADAPPIDAPPDTTAPETTITSAPAPFSSQGAATFGFASDDPAATFECSVDGAPRVTCASPYTRTLGNGTHTFSVRAIDPAGNGDPTPAERVWTIDTVPPETIMLLAPPAVDNSVMVRFEFRSNEPAAVFQCSLDGAAYTACTSGGLVGPIGDGPHSFAARARDPAGNVDTSPAIHAWVADTSTPDTTLLSGPSGATASTSATFTFLSPDAGSGATFQCALDGAAYAACTSPRELSGLTAGAHVFAVRVRDAAGNFDPTPATRAWTVDFTPPATTIVTGPSGVESLASASFTFVASEPDATFACSLDQAPFAPCVSPYIAASLAQGDHAFAVRATDAAGNVDSTPATRAWTDTIPPDVAITAGPASGDTSGPRVSFAFTVSGGAATCSLDNAPFTGCASPLVTNLPAGPHELRVRATDGAGNAATEVRAWTVACAAPDAAGAVGLLHLDTADQLLANSAGSGVPAILGDNATEENDDPAAAPGRFGGGLAFNAGQNDDVAWPLALAPLPALTVELWAKPAATGGTDDLLVSGDGRFAIRVVGAGASLVRFSATAVPEGGGPSFRAMSGNVDAAAWHHVLVSLQEPVLRLWVDGVRTDRDGVQLGGPPLLAEVSFGGNYDGVLDEVWVAQTPIADDEAALARYCPL